MGESIELAGGERAEEEGMLLVCCVPGEEGIEEPKSPLVLAAVANMGSGEPSRPPLTPRSRLVPAHVLLDVLLGSAGLSVWLSTPSNSCTDSGEETAWGSTHSSAMTSFAGREGSREISGGVTSIAGSSGELEPRNGGPGVARASALVPKSALSLAKGHRADIMRTGWCVI